MASSRTRVVSQLFLYRKHNLKYLDRKNDQYFSFKSMDELTLLPVYLNSLVPTYLNTIPKLVSSFIQLPKVNEVNKHEYRSTTSEDMDANNYDLDSKLKSLNKISASTKKGLNKESKSHYSTKSKRKMLENRLPTDRFSRAASLAGMVVNVASATSRDALGRYLRGEFKDVIKNSLTSDEVIKHVVECLCKMRGTALKFGQLLSLQTDVIPERFRQALISSRHEADVMPKSQVDEILVREFGDNWLNHFSEFDYTPIASASLGQVHKGKLKDGTDVAIKIQFPGILDSIDSDMENLVLICTYTGLVPSNFFIGQYAREMKTEIMAECDYNNESKFYNIFRELRLEGFHVPRVFDHLTTKTIITTEFVKGTPLEDLKEFPLNIRSSVAKRILKLSLSEIFVFELMNTDPNPSNYLYNEETDLIGLVDFGSCRIYNRKFVKMYLDLVLSCLKDDYDEIVKHSLKVGFLHPEETQIVIDAHMDSINASTEPFKYVGEYDFSKSESFKTCMDRSTIIFNHRKRPPPPEIYSLHRKLAGAFLICKILGAKFDSKKLFEDVISLSKEIDRSLDECN